MKATVLIALSFLLVISLGSCTKKTVDEYLLTEGEKSLIPFQGSETINYSLSGSDDLVSYKAGTPTSNIYEYSNDHTYINIWLLEQLSLEISNETGIITFYMQSASPNRPTEFRYNWDNEFDGFPSVGGTSWLPIDTTQTDTERIIGDLLIGDKTYHDVFVTDLTFPSSYNDTIFEGLAYPLNFYFSPNYGVVKMDFSDNTYWELENIEW